MKRKKKNSWGSLAVAAIVAAGASTLSMNLAAEQEPGMEKCYGIVNKGKSDCATPNHSCQGQSTQDGDPAEWIYVPKGTCNKIVGGILK